MLAAIISLLFPVLFACPEKFENVNSMCLAIPNLKATHRGARTHCESIGGFLVSIHNSIDNHAIMTYSKNLTSSIWIGLNCKENAQPEECTWDDGSRNDYNNFLPGYPVTKIGSCVYIDSFNEPLAGKWISANCVLDEPLYFICEAK